MPSKKRLLLSLLIPLAGILGLSLLPDDSGADGAPIVAAGDQLQGSFTIIGDPRVAPLSRVWAAEFMTLHPNVVITVTEDAGAGLTALLGGASLYQAMPEFSQEAITAAKAAGVDPYRIRMASDALSVIRWPWNPVELLTVAQVSDIFSGKIVNWKELGGNDAPIMVYAMPPGTEAYTFFKSRVLRMEGLPTEDNTIEFGRNVIFTASADEGNDLVAQDPNAVFFTTVNSVTQEVTPTWIARIAGEEPSKACLETTSAGIFPIYRPIYYYSNGAPEGVVKAFIEYCLSENGQDRVMLGGYLRLFFPNLTDRYTG